MSATNRTLARLPPEVFADLVTISDDGIASASPEELRDAICTKLKSFRRRTKTGVTHDSVKTVGALLRLSNPALMRVLDPLLTYGECRELYRRICVHCAPKSCNALDLLSNTHDLSGLDEAVVLSVSDRMRYLPSGLDGLDRLLRGGIRVGTITECVGRAGAGKTQLAMQLCVVAARYGQGTVFIDTERKLSLVRMKEIASKRATAFNSSSQQVPMSMNAADTLNGGFSYGGSGTFEDDQIGSGGGERGQSQQRDSALLQYRSPHDVLDNVTVRTPASTEELMTVMSTIEEEILMRNQDASTSSKFPVRLLVLDSIAAPARRDFGSGSAPQRAATICQIAQMLKRLADQLHLAVIVINQVGTTGETVEATSSHDTRAALGTAWHHCVSTRILVEYHNRALDESSRPQQGSPDSMHGNNVNTATDHVRRATIVKSNLAGEGSIEFEVNMMGVSERSRS